ncbi:hypothetical protein EBZ38_03325 [bacterium]|nr:hypothetical protein [bacterium]NDC93993.1 hypothetical protein [bacterium]NDD83298.1 hypothetical protein [bacterium]
MLRFIILLFTLTACGNQNNKIMLSLNGLEHEMVEFSLQELNNQSGKKLAILSTDKPYIVITRISQHEIGNNILGRAWVGGSQCKVEIADTTFQYGLEWVTTVVWHEIGHCHYLEHGGTPKDIMYESARPIYFYGKEDKERFFGRLNEIKD